MKNAFAGVTITNVEPGPSRLKDILSQETQENLYNDLKIESVQVNLPAYTTEDYDGHTKQPYIKNEVDPLADIPVFEITPETATAMRVSGATISTDNSAACSCK